MNVLNVMGVIGVKFSKIYIECIQGVCKNDVNEINLNYKKCARTHG